MLSVVSVPMILWSRNKHLRIVAPELLYTQMRSFLFCNTFFFFFSEVTRIVFFILWSLVLNYCCNVRDVHILYRHINHCARVTCAFFTPYRVSPHVLYKWVAFSHHHCHWEVCTHRRRPTEESLQVWSVTKHILMFESCVFNFFCIKQSCCPCTCFVIHAHGTEHKQLNFLHG